MRSDLVKQAALASVIWMFGSAPAGASTIVPPVPVIRQAPAGSVNIYRDDRGIAHLYAKREEDGWFGLGYAQAEDRLGGLLLYYLSLRGELSAAFGRGPVGVKHGMPELGPAPIEDALQSDIEMRRAGYLATARANLRQIDPQVRRNMEAYVAGVRRYMDLNPGRVPAWAPELEAALPLAAEAYMMGGVGGPPVGCDVTAPPARDGGGSNILAVSGARMAGGAAVFMSDSHGPVQVFGTFLYPARMRAGRIDAFLVDLVGIPIGLKGHGTDFGWGWAEGPRRPSDCIRIRTSGSDGLTYSFDGKPVRLEAETVRIGVRGEADMLVRIESSRHNGVRSPVVRRDGDDAYLISSAYADRAGGAATQFRDMLLARDWAAMDRALDRREIYPANIAIAGPEGRILYIRPGRIPVRPDGSAGGNIVDGNSSAGSWRGVRERRELVQLADPAEGYVANANVSPDMMFGVPRIRAEAFPADFAFVPGQTGTRQTRLIALMETGRTLDFEGVLAVTGDATIPGQAALARAVRAARALQAAEGVREEAAAAAFRERIEAFDGAFVPDSSGALAVAALRFQLRRQGKEAALPIELALASGTELTPDQARTLLRASDAAQDWLEARHPCARVFGDLFRSGRGGVEGPGRGLTLFPLPGDPKELTDFGSLWAGAYRERASDGRFVHLSGTRLPFAVQFTSPRRSVSLVVHGVSDNPASPHYADQSADFGEARFRSNLLEPSELGGHVRGLVVLRRQ